MNKKQLTAYILWLASKTESFEASALGEDFIGDTMMMGIEKTIYLGFGDILGVWGYNIQTFNEWKNIHFPYLLSEAIEGINRETKSGIIYQNSCCIWLRYKEHSFYTEKSFYFSNNPDKDMTDEPMYSSEKEAKNGALLFLYEKEKK